MAKLIQANSQRERKTVISTATDVIEMPPRETEQQLDFSENYGSPKRVHAYITNRFLMTRHTSKVIIYW